MKVSYDVFTAAFLSKITEYDFIHLSEENRQTLVDGYMKRACAKFSEVCEYDIVNGDDEERTFEFVKNNIDITPGELEEIIDIVSTGMLVQWFTQYFYKQENLENVLNTSDFSSYSPAELLYRMTNAFDVCKTDFIAMVREYSYRHGDLTDLHI